MQRDAAAVERAKQLMPDHAAEVWHRGRLIMRINRVNGKGCRLDHGTPELKE